MYRDNKYVRDMIPGVRVRLCVYVSCVLVSYIHCVNIWKFVPIAFVKMAATYNQIRLAPIIPMFHHSKQIKNLTKIWIIMRRARETILIGEIMRKMFYIAIAEWKQTKLIEKQNICSKYVLIHQLIDHPI